MPSDFIVPLTKIDSVSPHPNADRLEIATVLGWQVVVGKGTYQPGDIVVYVPPDSVLPETLSDALDVTKYLSKGRVKAVKLRGEPSFGLAFDPTNVIGYGMDVNAIPLGSDVSRAFGITKYEPAPTFRMEDAAREHPLFARYTNVENLRNYPNVFTDREFVYVTEKVHGTNCRVGLVEGELMAGSHKVQRKRPEGDDFSSSTYWFPLTVPGVKKLLEDLASDGRRQVIIYGEVYGRVQKLHYGNPNGLSFVAFDILVDGHFINWDEAHKFLSMNGINVVPTLYMGPYSLEKIKELAQGNTTVGRDGPVDVGENILEGVVVKPRVERTHPKVGRVIMKYISDAYLFGDADVAGADDVAK